MSTDLKCSPREASDCPIFGLCNGGHIHIATSSSVDDINDFWLPLGRDLRHGGIGLGHNLVKAPDTIYI